MAPLNETEQAVESGDMIDNYYRDNVWPFWTKMNNQLIILTWSITTAVICIAFLNETKQTVDNGDMIGNYYSDMYGPFMKMLNYDFRLFPYSC
jgi:hypothetical protein